MKQFATILVFLLAAWAVIPATGFASGSFTTSGPAAGGGTTNVSQGAGTVGNGTAGSTTNAPKSCDFEALKKSITSSESSGGGCGYTGSTNSSQGSTAGRYQFTAGTYSAMVKGCPNESSCSFSQMRGNTACCQAEECAMNNLLASNMAKAKTDPACQQLLGKSFTTRQSWPEGGKRTETPTTCTVTMSGLLGAMHLGGPGACRSITSGRNGGQGAGDGCVPKHDCGTFVGTYLCKFSGKAVPEDCTPQQQGDPNTGGPAGTLQQIQYQENSGVPVITGCSNCLKDWWVAALMLMAEQFTVNMEKQIEMFGTLLDAKHQMETQRLFNEKMAEAHKDYQPSEQMCTFGTFSRDLSSTQRVADLTKVAISKDLLQRELGSGDTKSLFATSDTLTRLKQFTTRFCNQKDNNNGLARLCKQSGPAELQNRDIDYTTTVDLPLSFKIDPNDTDVTIDEESVFALVDNLFMHDPPLRPNEISMGMSKFKYHYMNYRSLVAMRGIARNTIANIIAQKTQTPYKDGATPGSGPYMKRMMLEFGFSEEDLKKYLGDNPSYYAQMEMLTKKMYQNPNFYAQLYDKPANVKRIRAAMHAIKLMQDRDIQGAFQRREMLLSMILEMRLREKSEEVYNATERAIYGEQ